MKRLILFWILACLVAAAPAQQTRKKSAGQKTTVTKKTTTKKTGTKKTTTKKTTSTQKKPGVTVNSLKNEQAQVRQQIKEQERRLKANEQDVKKRLQNLMVINNEIADKRRTIDTIRGVDALYAPQPKHPESDDVYLQCEELLPDVPSSALRP